MFDLDRFYYVYKVKAYVQLFCEKNICHNTKAKMLTQI